MVTYLEYISPPVTSLSHVDSIYFDLINSFDFVLPPILLHRLCAHGFTVGYVKRFHSYLSIRQYSVRILRNPSFLLEDFFRGPTGICFRTFAS
jgi:hypothetical protein